MSLAPRLRAANEAPTARDRAIAGANDLALDGDWLKITPWGDFPNKVGLQRVQAEDGRRMVAAFNSLRGRLSRLFRGLPIYVGHPDIAPDRYPDRRRYGRIDALEVRQDGLYGQIGLNDLGKQAIEQGHYLYCSPTWYLRPDGDLMRPDELISLGLTNTPNIPGDPWANESSTPDTMERKKLALLLGLNEAATDADIEAAIGGLKAKADKIPALESQLTTATNERQTVVTERDTLKADLAKRDTTIVDLRKARLERELDIAVNEGRITAAERPTWASKLEKDFAAGTAELGAKKVAVNTNNRVAGLADRKAEGSIADPQGEAKTFVDDRIKAGNTREQAVRALVEERPELHAAWLKSGGSARF